MFKNRAAALFGMDVERLTYRELHSKKYAEAFFKEESEMSGIFKADTSILDSMIKKGRILDVAMGPGRHVKHFAEKGFEVWGNDINKHMITAAKNYVKGRKARFLNNDMRNLSDAKSGYFDHVICMGASLGSVYRKEQRQLAVNEMARAVRKNGLVFIHVHNLADISEFCNSVNSVIRHILHPRKFEFGDVIYYHGRVLGNAYMHWFTPGELRKLMANAGLRVEREFYLKSPDQEKILSNSLLKYFRAGGFVFMGRKI